MTLFVEVSFGRLQKMIFPFVLVRTVQSKSVELYLEFSFWQDCKEVIVRC